MVLSLCKDTCCNPITPICAALCVYKMGSNALATFQASQKVNLICPETIHNFAALVTSSRTCQEHTLVYTSSAFYGLMWAGALVLLTLCSVRCCHRPLRARVARPLPSERID